MKDKLKKMAAPICIVFVVLGCIIWIIIQNSCSRQGNIAEVRVSDRTVLRLSLDKDITREIDGQNGIKLTVVVSSGSVYVEHSGCPDKICVNKGRVSAVGDTIVCLPARTVVEVIES